MIMCKDCQGLKTENKGAVAKLIEFCYAPFAKKINLPLKAKGEISAKNEKI